MSTPTPSQPESPAEAGTSRAPKLGLVHGSAGLVFRLRSMADSDQYAINDWSEDILRQAADEIEKAEAGYQCLARNSENLQQRYNELIYEVGQKHEGESRHDTARRYIRERENRIEGACSSLQNAKVCDAGERPKHDL